MTAERAMYWLEYESGNVAAGTLNIEQAVSAVNQSKASFP
jgi:hypothetical protein